MTSRYLQQPGPATEPRILGIPCSARSVELRFSADVAVHRAISDAMAAENIESAIIEFASADLSPLVYVIPAQSPDEEHVAWYSDRRRPAGVARFESAVMSFGFDHGAPFLHCHGLWTHADGIRGGGHLIPEEAVFAVDATATVWVVEGARFERLADAETNFSLLTPVKGGECTFSPQASRALLVRIKPNSDIHASIEAIASAHHIEQATVHGVCSLIDCDFVNGDHMASFASEAFIKNGSIDDGNVRLEIGVTALDGRVFEGEIVRGGNITCIACELLIVERNATFGVQSAARLAGEQARVAPRGLEKQKEQE